MTKDYRYRKAGIGLRGGGSREKRWSDVGPTFFAYPPFLHPPFYGAKTTSAAVSRSIKGFFRAEHVAKTTSADGLGYMGVKPWQHSLKLPAFLTSHKKVPYLFVSSVSVGLL